VQGLLGGLRVVLYKNELGIFHATLAQFFFVLLCAIALLNSEWWQTGRWKTAPAPTKANLRWAVLLTTVLIFGQLMLGATMRHQHAGLAIPDFPLAYGKVWPAMDAASVQTYNLQRREIASANEITAFQIGLQMAHRILAVLIVAGVVFCARAAKGHALAKVAYLWAGLVLVQALLGASTIWSNKAADVATAHVLIGALCLATGTLFCLVSFQNLARARSSHKAPVADLPLEPSRVSG
jgi:cytochrome c oxidase assembly protein subunit 15